MILVFLLILTAFCSMYFWLLWPNDPGLIYPYLFKPDIGINRQGFIDYAGYRIAFSTMLFVIWKLIPPEYNGEMRLIWILSIFYVIDYLLMYHEPFLKIGRIPLSYSLFMGFMIFLTFIKVVFK